MEIAPVSGIRAIAAVKPVQSAPDLAGVFAVEFRRQAQDDSYTSSQRKAARGLEDEERDGDVAEEVDVSGGESELAEAAQYDRSGTSISFFA